MSTATVGLVDRVRSRLAAAGGDTDPAAVAAAVRAESGGVASDLDVLAALRTLRQDLVRWMEEREWTSLADMRGNMSLERCPDPSAYERANYMLLLQGWHGAEGLMTRGRA